MKKYLAWLLAAVMILSLAGCGKKQETAEDTQKQTEASEKAPVKEATEASTEAPTEAPALSEEEAFRTWVGHLKELAEAMKDRETKEAQSLTLKGRVELDAALTVAQGEEKQEFSVGLSGSGTARLNTRQGAEAEAVYKADLGALAGMFGGSGDAQAEEKAAHFFLDFENGKEYRLEDDGETWTWSPLSMNTEEAELEKLDELTADKLFAEHSFKAADGRYVFEGKVALDKLTEGENGLAGELEEFGLEPDALTPQLRLVLDADCRLESVTLSVEPLSLDIPLGELTKISVNLKTLKLEVKADCSEVKIEIPAEVAEKAVEREDDPIGFPDPFEEPTEEVRDLGNTVVADNEYFKVTAVSSGFDFIDDYTVRLLVENRWNKTITVRSDGADVNGYFVEFFMSEDIEAGESKEIEGFIDSADLKKIGIEEPEELLIRVNAREENDYSGDPLKAESFVLYPTGKNADTVTYPERRNGENELVLVDNDDFTVVALDASRDENLGWTIVEFYLENKTDKTIDISLDDTKINGEEVSLWFMEELPAGIRTYANGSVSDDDLEKAGIESIQKIDFTLEIEDADDWMADPLFEEEFSWEW